MRLNALQINNFRGLSYIDVHFDRIVSVIVGPNAIGKTSILEAIRLTKGLLSPRFPTEPQTMINDMGAALMNTVRFESLAGDTTKPVQISLTLKLEARELDILKGEINRLYILHLRNSNGIAPNIDDVSLAPFLSSPQGKLLMTKATAEVDEKLKNLGVTPEIKLELTISPKGGMSRGNDLLAQELIALLEQILPASKTYFSYYPADRALPTGEVTIQVGQGDTQAQLNSYMANPCTKYGRLKNLIVTQALDGKSGSEMQTDFATIFSHLLTGKELKNIAVGPNGTFSVQIGETGTTKIYEIDRMSSGEKGLILQFLSIRCSLIEGGIILLDEPELHLNPAVCRKLTSFLIEHVLQSRGIQAIICTHSPEILTTAFARDDCSLFHLRAGNDLTPVLKKDKEEIYEALARLGAKTPDYVLFSKGTIFVEGPDDIELLESGFPNRLNGYRITELHGRNEVEKEINTLQKAEAEARLDSSHFFIFDRDQSITTLKSSRLVKVYQWDRYCLENFLLDGDSICDVINAIRVRQTISRGLMPSKLKELAMAQLKGVVVRSVYATLEPENAGLRSKEIDSAHDYSKMGAILFNRINAIHTSISNLSQKTWIDNLVALCEKKESELIEVWNGKWDRECDGKQLLFDLYKYLQTNIPFSDFKKMVMEEMAKGPSENWRIVDNVLEILLRSGTPEK